MIRHYPTYNLPLPVCPVCDGDPLFGYSDPDEVCPACGPRVICACGSGLAVTDTGSCVVCCFSPLPEAVAS